MKCDRLLCARACVHLHRSDGDGLWAICGFFFFICYLVPEVRAAHYNYIINIPIWNWNEIVVKRFVSFLIRIFNCNCLFEWCDRNHRSSLLYHYYFIIIIIYNLSSYHCVIIPSSLGNRFKILPVPHKLLHPRLRSIFRFLSNHATYRFVSILSLSFLSSIRLHWFDRQIYSIDAIAFFGWLIIFLEFQFFFHSNHVGWKLWVRIAWNMLWCHKAHDANDALALTIRPNLKQLMRTHTRMTISDEHQRTIVFIVATNGKESA